MEGRGSELGKERRIESGASLRRKQTKKAEPFLLGRSRSRARLDDR